MFNTTDNAYEGQEQSTISEAVKKADQASADAIYPLPDVSLLNEANSIAPSFPFGCFGEQWDGFIRDASCSLNVPADYIGSALLASVAGCIGNSLKVEIWAGWTEPYILWLCNVGSPASAKSPAAKPFRNVLEGIEAALNVDYKENLRCYEMEMEEARIAKELWRKERMAKDGHKKPMPDAAKEPPKPTLERIVVDDATVEKVATIISQNPKGALIIKDELAWLLGNFQRRGGNDRAFYLPAYSAEAHKVDRVKHDEPIIIPALAISILGGIQPDVLQKCLFEGEDDGFAARFLYAWPKQKTFARPSGRYDIAMLQSALHRLCAIEFELDIYGAPVAQKVKMDEAGSSRIETFGREMQIESNQCSGLMASTLGKMRGTVSRIALVLQMLDWAIGGDKKPPAILDVCYVDRAIALASDYYIPMAERCFGHAALAQPLKDAIAIAKWIIRESKTHEAHAADMTQHVAELKRDVARRDKAIEVLIEKAWLYEKPRKEKAAGRAPQIYLVNPRLSEVTQ
jgi:hypothetical protein